MYHCKVKVHSCKLHIINANALLISHYTNSVQRKRVEWKLWNNLLSLKHFFHVIFHYYFLLYLAKLLFKKHQGCILCGLCLWLHTRRHYYFMWSVGPNHLHLLQQISVKKTYKVFLDLAGVCNGTLPWRNCSILVN